MFDFDPALRLVGLAGSEMIRAGKLLGLTTWQEVFADRNYQADGTLVPRSQPDALITDDQQALRHTLMMVQHNQIVTPQGDRVPVQADTVCLHGDSMHALAFAQLLRQHFFQQGIEVGAG